MAIKSKNCRKYAIFSTLINDCFRLSIQCSQKVFLPIRSADQLDQTIQKKMIFVSDFTLFGKDFNLITKVKYFKCPTLILLSKEKNNAFLPFIGLFQFFCCLWSTISPVLCIIDLNNPSIISKSYCWNFPISDHCDWRGILLVLIKYFLHLKKKKCFCFVLF